MRNVKLIHRLVLVCFCTAWLAACVSVSSISQSEMKVTKGQRIEATDSHTAVLSLYAPQLSTMKELAEQCPGGLVTGIETTLIKRDFFVVQLYLLQSKASCQGRVN
jgi:hypothetical protein